MIDLIELDVLAIIGFIAAGWWLDCSHRTGAGIIDKMISPAGFGGIGLAYVIVRRTLV